MKLRRKIVAEHFADEIDALWRRITTTTITLSRA